MKQKVRNGGKASDAWNFVRQMAELGSGSDPESDASTSSSDSSTEEIQDHPNPIPPQNELSCPSKDDRIKSLEDELALLRKAQNAADYHADRSDQSDHMVVTKEEFLVKDSTILLNKKRQEERKRKKVDKAVQMYCGSANSVRIQKRAYKGKMKSFEKKRKYEMVCPECTVTVLGSHLKEHLWIKHPKKWNKNSAKMRESEMRVMYLWASKPNFKSQPKPLPCEECHNWHLRLDAHLVKHKAHANLNGEERGGIMRRMRLKYWGNEVTQKPSEFNKPLSAAHTKEVTTPMVESTSFPQGKSTGMCHLMLY